MLNPGSIDPAKTRRIFEGDLVIGSCRALDRAIYGYVEVGLLRRRVLSACVGEGGFKVRRVGEGGIVNAGSV